MSCEHRRKAFSTSFDSTRVDSTRSLSTRALSMRALSILFAGVAVTSAQIGTAQAAEPSVRIKTEVRGTQRTDNYKYQYEMLCVRTNGSSVQTSDAKNQLIVTVGKGETVTIGTKEFPSLTLDDSCSIRLSNSVTGVTSKSVGTATQTSIGNANSNSVGSGASSGVSTATSASAGGAPSADDGSETTFKTTNGVRSDGSVRDTSPGLISSGTYRSAPAAATGETITATHSYTGDLVVTNRVEGVPANGTAIIPISIRCDNQGISRTLNLSDGDRELITGIPTGSSCRVTTLTGRSRTEDNSGSPNDGVVVISPIRPECLDLRNSSPDCRATVTVSTAYEPALDPTRVSDPNESTTTAPTTTNPDDANRQNAQPSVAAPATAAPAVAPAPAIAVDATPVFSG